MSTVVSRLKSRVETVVQENGPARFPLTAALLQFLSRGYEKAVRIRASRYGRGHLTSRNLPCIVVSVGNLTVGGTGKTPMTRYLAELIRGFGLRVAVLSRGYRGQAEGCGGIVSDGRQVFMGPEAAGDEPFMMATALKGVPVIVGRDRYRGGLTAVGAFGSEIVLLDDAFQHMQLSRDLDIVLLDGGRHPLGNGHLLPRGPLREPVAALKRADAIVFTRCRDRRGSHLSPELGRSIQGIPRFQSTHVPIGSWVPAGTPGLSSSALPPFFFQDSQMLAGRRVLAFSGIAGNRGFHRTVRGLGASVEGFIGFDDHHPYSSGDCRKLCVKAMTLKADAMVTTYKDYVKIAHRGNWPVDLAVVDIQLSLGPDAAAFHEFIRRRLRALDKLGGSGGRWQTSAMSSTN